MTAYPYHLATVVRRHQLTPHMIRIALGGSDLADFAPRAPEARAQIWVEIADRTEEQQLNTPPLATLRWLHRGATPPGRSTVLLDAVRGATFPPGSPYAWVAGEAGMVRALRRHLVNQRGIDKAAITFTGYWRLGKTETDEYTAQELGRS